MHVRSQFAGPAYKQILDKRYIKVKQRLAKISIYLDLAALKL